MAVGRPAALSRGGIPASRRRRERSPAESQTPRRPNSLGGPQWPHGLIRLRVAATSAVISTPGLTVSALPRPGNLSLIGQGAGSWQRQPAAQCGGGACVSGVSRLTRPSFLIHHLSSKNSLGLPLTPPLRASSGISFHVRVRLRTPRVERTGLNDDCAPRLSEGDAAHGQL